MDKPKLILTERIINQCKYLCQKVPHLEWSGVIFYNVEGSIKDPKNMVVVIKDIILMDIGTAGATSFQWDAPAIIDYRVDNNDFHSIMGHIHSHNSMGVFFSGTDNEELSDNCPSFNFYLSVIVNNAMDVCAKIAVGVSGSMQAKDELGMPFEYQSAAMMMLVYDCDIRKEIIPINVSPEFEARYTAIETKIAEEKARKAAYRNPNSQLTLYNKPVNVLDAYNDEQWGEGNVLGDWERDTRTDIFTEREEYLSYILSGGAEVARTVNQTLNLLDKLTISKEAYAQQIIKLYPKLYFKFWKAEETVGKADHIKWSFNRLMYDMEKYADWNTQGYAATLFDAFKTVSLTQLFNANLKKKKHVNRTK